MRLIVIFLLALILSIDSFAAKTKLDKETGLIIAPGMEEVKINCIACHSSKFITFQKGDRDTWLAMIRWMQKTQGLWELDKKTEDIILTYLETNYPPGKSSRRPNLKAGALPQNPYEN